MHRQIYVNLAVQDLPRARRFFEQLGLGFDARYSNDAGACLVLGENIYAMLLRQEFFKTFTDKPLCEPAAATEVLVCLSCDSRAEVDDIVARARAAGGRVPREPQDHGFMYAHGFEDLDGHIWELVYMDADAAPAGAGAA
jgi:predicted lactoylglutathione lyase